MKPKDLDKIIGKKDLVELDKEIVIKIENDKSIQELMEYFTENIPTNNNDDSSCPYNSMEKLNEIEKIITTDVENGLENKLEKMETPEVIKPIKIGPLKHIVYNAVLKTTGINLYRNEIVKYKNHLMKEKDRLEVVIGEYKAVLGNSCDDDNVSINEKGLIAQENYHLTICKGMSYAIKRIDSVMKIKNIQLDLYNNKSAELNSEYAKLVNNEMVELKNNLNVLEREKKNLLVKFKESHRTHSMIKLARENYEKNIEKGYKCLIKLENDISYFRNLKINGFSNLKDFQEGLEINLENDLYFKKLNEYKNKK